jgi:hypothetical protein
LSIIKLNIAPHQSKAAFEALNPVVSAIAKRSVSEREMSTYVNQCYKLLAKADTVTPKFLTWVTLTMKKADPKTVEKFMNELGKTLKSAHKTTRLVTHEWGVATLLNSHETAASGKEPPRPKRPLEKDSSDHETKKPRSDTCDGCGRRGHIKSVCILKDHPDWNKSYGPWPDSDPGKAWAAKQRDTLPAKLTLSGAAINIELPQRTKSSKK